MNGLFLCRGLRLIKRKRMTAVCPPLSLPANSQFFRPTATARNPCPALRRLVNDLCGRLHAYPVAVFGYSLEDDQIMDLQNAGILVFQRCMCVVLPAPLGPRKPTISPARTLKSTPRHVNRTFFSAHFETVTLTLRFPEFACNSSSSSG